jgi:hypothetical protein
MILPPDVLLAIARAVDPTALRFRSDVDLGQDDTSGADLYAPFPMQKGYFRLFLAISGRIKYDPGRG